MGGCKIGSRRGLVRGARDLFTFEAKQGQRASIQIRSPEQNAVFQVGGDFFDGRVNDFQDNVGLFIIIGGIKFLDQIPNAVQEPVGPRNALLIPTGAKIERRSEHQVGAQRVGAVPAVYDFERIDAVAFRFGKRAAVAGGEPGGRAG